MATPFTFESRTLVQSMSFYVPASSCAAAVACSKVAEAITLKGPNGPSIARQMRSTGWDGTVIFDRAAYEPRSARIDPSLWEHDQQLAGADRLLSPGRWVPWTGNPTDIAAAIATERAFVRRWSEPTLVVAVDHRWLTKTEGLRALHAALKDVDSPVALVLANSGDPLGATSAVDSLVHLARSTNDLTILRCDHGAIGAVAFGAAHGSIGLTSTYRHFVPPETKAGGIPGDRTVRLFVLDLVDWFTAATIAGWSTTRVRRTCDLSCCDGQPLSRFLDDRLAAEAALHNRLALWKLIEFTLDGVAEEPQFAFPTICANAVELYGQVGGFTSIIEPKAQLVQWAQLAR